MLLRFTNTAILGLVALLTLTGLYGIVWPFPAWLFDVHRGAGWALTALIPWKAVISLRSLKRGLAPRFDRSVVVVVSIALAAATLGILALGLLWAWRQGPDVLWLGSYGDTLISWHWMLALGILPLFALHAWRRWPRPRRSDFVSRRGALKLFGLGMAGAAGWWAAAYLAQGRNDPASPRRFTGSREQGSFTGNGFPITNSLGDGEIRPDPETWRLTVSGMVNTPLALTYAEMLALPVAEVTATIDCTTGWYSTQVWRGVRLAVVLALAGARSPAGGVRLQAASGYAMNFSPAEVPEILLATQVGEQVLDHWHGFPLRAVVPSRRGWFWVKWLTGIEALARTA